VGWRFDTPPLYEESFMEGRVRLHPGVTRHKSEIKRVATLLGLNQIDFDETYSLYKLGAKNASRLGYPDKMLAMRAGGVAIVGVVEEEKTHVWIVVESLRDWFKTSPIVSCKKDGENFLIETENSYYELRKV
jgi:hypothetical protein